MHGIQPTNFYENNNKPYFINIEKFLITEEF